MADDEWLQNYEDEEEENSVLKVKLRARLGGSVEVTRWGVSNIHVTQIAIVNKRCDQSGLLLQVLL